MTEGMAFFTTFVNLDNSQQGNLVGLSNVYYFFVIFLCAAESLIFSLPIEFYVKRKPFPIIINAFYFLTGLEY